MSASLSANPAGLGGVGIAKSSLAGRTVLFGAGAVRGLPEACSAAGATDPLLLLTGVSAWSGPLKQAVLSVLHQRSVTHLAVPPGFLTPDKVFALLRDVPADVSGVLAIGGGRVIDAAKCVIRAIQSLTAEPLPLVAVPTTAGSGAEMTGFATLWDLSRNRKRSVESDSMVASVAVVDPELAATCPPHVAASAALDALCQAVESAWSTRSTAETRGWSFEALARVVPAIAGLAGGDNSVAIFSDLSAGATLAGAAISRTHTTTAHAVSYPFTLRLGLDHGHAAALTLGRCVRYNAEVSDLDCVDTRGADYVREIVAKIRHRLAVVADHYETLDGLIRALGLRPLGGLNFNPEVIASEALSYDRAGNNPRSVSHAQLVAILRSPSR